MNTAKTTSSETDMSQIRNNTDEASIVIGPNNESVGRMVHFAFKGETDFVPVIYPAIVTAIPRTGYASLKVFTPTGFADYAAVGYSETYRPGFWSWPANIRDNKTNVRGAVNINTATESTAEV